MGGTLGSGFLDTITAIGQNVVYVLGGCFVLVALLVIVVAIVSAFIKPYREEHKAHRKRAERGEGMGVDELAGRLDTSIRELLAVSLDYHVAHVPKRSGGTRTLHVPNPQLKAIQRRIARRLLAKLTAHPAAHGFEPGKSIVHNALPHVGRAVVIKMDIIDFFPSTTEDRVDHYFRRIGWNAEAAALLTTLVTHDSRLPQGAPTSPRLSILLNHVMDARIDRYVTKHRGNYTRYADDITISYPQDWPKYVRGSVQVVRRAARSFGYEVHLRKKLHILRRHQQQRVTGLVVNEKVQLPRELRRQLRAIEHRLRTTGSATMSESELAGWQSLLRMIEKQRGEAA